MLELRWTFTGRILRTGKAPSRRIVGPAAFPPVRFLDVIIEYVYCHLVFSLAIFFFNVLHHVIIQPLGVIIVNIVSVMNIDLSSSLPCIFLSTYVISRTTKHPFSIQSSKIRF